MVLKVPRLNSSPLALCDRPFSLLGFGDILVPGNEPTSEHEEPKLLKPNDVVLLSKAENNFTLNYVIKCRETLRIIVSDVMTRGSIIDMNASLLSLVSGLLVAYCHRFDILTQSSRIYFVACTIGTYMCGGVGGAVLGEMSLQCYDELHSDRISNTGGWGIHHYCNSLSHQCM